MKLISFDYRAGTVTISKTIGNIVYLKIIPWSEMKLQALEAIHANQT